MHKLTECLISIPNLKPCYLVYYFTWVCLPCLQKVTNLKISRWDTRPSEWIKGFQHFFFSNRISLQMNITINIFLYNIGIQVLENSKLKQHKLPLVYPFKEYNKILMQMYTYWPRNLINVNIHVSLKRFIPCHKIYKVKAVGLSLSN